MAQDHQSASGEELSPVFGLAQVHVTRMSRQVEKRGGWGDNVRGSHGELGDVEAGEEAECSQLPNHVHSISVSTTEEKLRRR